MKNLGLKIISIAIAISLYLFVTDQSNSSELTLTVPIEIVNLPPEKIVILPLNKQASISLVGPSFVISKINPRDLKFDVTLPEDIGDFHMVNLDISMINLPRYVDLVAIEPRQQEFVFDSLLDEDVPIHIPETGRLPSHLELDSIKPVVESIKLKCPAKELKRIRRIETTPVDLSVVKTSETKRLDFIVPSYCTLEQDSVDVNIKVNKARVERVFANIPVKVRGDRYKVSPAEVSVELSGEVEVISALSVKKIVAFVRPKPSESDAEIQIELPEGLDLVAATPSKVKVLRKK